MNNLKQRVIKFFKFIVRKVGTGKLGKTFNDQVIDFVLQQKERVTHNGVTLHLSTPTWLTRWRAATFASKEPETLDWIDSLPTDSVIWDIGANIGLYTLYAAQKRQCRVWAFEPSVFNLELLARNIYNNGMVKQVCIVPFALSDHSGFSELHMSSTAWSGALSTFGEKYGWDGKEISQVFEFKTIGLTMEDAVNKLGLPVPDYIKIDVDGIEHLILSGGKEILKFVKGVHIEVNDAFHEQAEQCSKILSDAGLRLESKRHSDMIENSETGFSDTFNQTWIR